MLKTVKKTIPFFKKNILKQNNAIDPNRIV